MPIVSDPLLTELEWTELWLKDYRTTLRSLCNDPDGDILTDQRADVFIKESQGLATYIAAALFCQSIGNFEAADRFLRFCGSPDLRSRQLPMNPKENNQQ